MLKVELQEIKRSKHSDNSFNTSTRSSSKMSKKGGSHEPLLKDEESTVRAGVPVKMNIDQEVSTNLCFFYVPV